MIARVLPLLLVGGLACSALGQGTLAEYSGNGSSNTRPFSAPSGWEVQWNASGDIFQVYVFDMEGDLVEVAANQMGPGSGASFIAREGTYYLQVNAMGSWALRVVQLPPQSATRLSGSISFSGDGIQNTRPFSVDGPWEVQWAASGDLFQVYVFSANGDLVDVMANQMGPGQGSSFQPRGGDFYLQVNAVGSWDLRVVPFR